MGKTKRLLLATAGVILVGIGALGVFVPGLPTTVFLIGASWCFLRSSPALERKLIGSKLFAPYQKYLDGKHVMPTKARVMTIIIIWSMISLSSAMLYSRGKLTPMMMALFASLALIGSIAVWRFRREPKGVAAALGGECPLRAPLEKADAG